MPAPRRIPRSDVRPVRPDERVVLLDPDRERALLAHRAVVADLADGAPDPAAAGRLYDAVRTAWAAHRPSADPAPLVATFTTALGDLVVRLAAADGLALRHARLVQPRGAGDALVLTDVAASLVVDLEPAVRRGWRAPGSGWLPAQADDLAAAARRLRG